MTGVAERLEVIEMVPAGRFRVGTIPQGDDMVHFEPFSAAAAGTTVIVARFSGVAGVRPKVISQPNEAAGVAITPFGPAEPLCLDRRSAASGANTAAGRPIGAYAYVGHRAFTIAERGECGGVTVSAPEIRV